MSLEEKIITLLSQNDPMRPGAIAEALEADRKEVDLAIKALKAREAIISPKRCFYSLAK